MNKKHAKVLRLLNQILYISSAAMLIAGAFLTTMPQRVEASSGVESNGAECVVTKITICHYDSGQGGKYTKNTVDDNSIIKKVNGTCTVLNNGHGKHTNDIIPAFTMGEGCTFPAQGNQDYLRTGCATPVYGCMDKSATNYNNKANIDNGSCTYPPAPTQITYCDYHNSSHSYTLETANDTALIKKDDGHCQKIGDGNSSSSIIPGFTSSEGCVFNAQGNQAYLLTGCKTPVYGCTDPTATNYNPAANINDGSCTYPPVPVPGCTDSKATNYNPAATVDDGSCTYPPVPVPGCMDDAATNYNPAATVDDGSCTYPPVPVPGCMDDAATNYNPAATVDDGSCTYPPVPVPGCTDSKATNYNPAATVDDGSCTYPPEPVPGCTDEAALNYNEIATVDDGSCEYPPDDVPGCTDKEALNYNAEATVDDGSCTYEGETPGCTDPAAQNYNADATVDNGSCTYKKTVIDPKELSVEIDPFCTYEGLMQWTIINPYSTNIYLNRFTVDGVNHGGFWVAPGEHDLVVTDLGTHTVVVYFGEAGATDSLTYTIDVCPLQIPVTGGDALIPVTGADETGKLGMGFGLGGMSLVGMAMLVSALRKIYHL
jgi:hypothetical protein